MKTKREFKNLRTRKQNYVIGQILRCSTSYVLKKLDRIKVSSREEFLRRYKLEKVEHPRKERFNIDTVADLIKRTEEYRNLKTQLEERESTKGFSLKFDIYAVNPGNRVKENNYRTNHDEKTFYIYFHIMEDKFGFYSIWYCNPIDHVWTRMKKVRGRGDFLEIEGTFLRNEFKDDDSAEPNVITHIKRRHLIRGIQERLKKPLTCGQDEMGVYIQYGNIKYHVEGQLRNNRSYFLDPLRKAKYCNLELLRTYCANNGGKFFTAVIKSTIHKIKRQMDEERRILEEKGMKDKLFENLSNMYLDFNESLETGNCVPGTTQMYNLAKKEVGVKDDSPCAIRGDIVLDIVKKEAPHFLRNFEILASYTARNHYKHLFKTA